MPFLLTLTEDVAVGVVVVVVWIEVAILLLVGVELCAGREEIVEENAGLTESQVPKAELQPVPQWSVVEPL